MIHDSSLWQSLFSPVCVTLIFTCPWPRSKIIPRARASTTLFVQHGQYMQGLFFGRSSYKLTLQKCGDLLLNIVFLDLGVSGGKGGPFWWTLIQVISIGKVGVHLCSLPLCAFSYSFDQPRIRPPPPRRWNLDLYEINQNQREHDICPALPM